MELNIQVDDREADRIFVDLLLNCYYDYTGDLAKYADDSEALALACKTLLKVYMVPSEYRETFYE
jgi:hypothetical protein